MWQQVYVYNHPSTRRARIKKAQDYRLFPDDVELSQPCIHFSVVITANFVPFSKYMLHRRHRVTPPPIDQRSIGARSDVRRQRRHARRRFISWQVWWRIGPGQLAVSRHSQQQTNTNNRWSTAFTSEGMPVCTDLASVLASRGLEWHINTTEPMAVVLGGEMLA